MNVVLDVLPDALAICRLGTSAAVPEWATSGPFSSITRTNTELSIICASALVPDGVATSRGWRALVLRGPFDFNLVGVLLAVIDPLAAAGVSIMTIATYDTDYVLVRDHHLQRAIAALANAGHEVRT